MMLYPGVFLEYSFGLLSTPDTFQSPDNTAVGMVRKKSHKRVCKLLELLAINEHLLGQL